MSDAEKLALPLVTVGAGTGNIATMHDWHYLFGRMGLLRSCDSSSTVSPMLFL
jgi:hypothetical protein